MLPPEVAPLPETADKLWHATGSGWTVYGEVMQPRFESHVAAFSPELLPSAAYIAELAVWGYQSGEAVSAELAQPVYLRNKVAKTTQERQKKD